MMVMLPSVFNQKERTMKVTSIDLNETGDIERDTTVILVDEGGPYETIIRVTGFGCGEYTWDVRVGKAAVDFDPEDLMTMAFGPKPAGGWVGRETLGTGMVWVSKTTFAHIIVDICLNQ